MIDVDNSSSAHEGKDHGASRATRRSSTSSRTAARKISFLLEPKRLDRALNAWTRRRTARSTSTSGAWSVVREIVFCLAR